MAAGLLKLISYHLAPRQYAVVLLSEGRPGEKITFADQNNEQ